MPALAAFLSVSKAGDTVYTTLEGVVLRETEYNDTDKLLTILTKTQGKITAKARGVKRRSSTIKGACQLFVLSEFTLFSQQHSLIIRDAAAKEMFTPLREDLELLSLASYFAQVMEVVSQEDAANPALLSLLLNAFYALTRLEKPQRLVKAAFEFRLACLAGYEPQLMGCAVCGEPTPDRLNLTHGVLQCAKCSHSELEGVRLPISRTVLDALRFLAYSDGRHLFSFHLPPDAMRELGEVTQSYLCAQLERGFSALDFYNSLQMT